MLKLQVSFALPTHHLQCTQCQSHALVYLVSTAMNIDGLIGDGVSIDIIWNYASSGQHYVSPQRN